MPCGLPTGRWFLRPVGRNEPATDVVAGWQPHSTGGAISGLLRKRLGLNVVLTLDALGERVYRLG